MTFEGEFERIEEEREQENGCDYGFGCCIDQTLRDHSSCIGCELLYPPREAKQSPLCPKCGSIAEEDSEKAVHE